MQMFAEILKDRLKDFKISSETGELSGYVDTEESYNALLMGLKRVGYSYAVRRSDKKIGIGEAGFKFKQKVGKVPIHFFGAAFKSVSKVHMECVLGPRYKKRKTHETVAGHPEEAAHLRKKRRTPRNTKKSGCPAYINVVCIRVFPECRLEALGDWRIKKKAIEGLKKQYSASEQPKSFLRYFVVASPEESHTHSVEATKTTDEIHPLLAKEIQRLVEEEGITSVKDLRAPLERFVDTLFPDSQKPEKPNAAFFPSDNVIYIHMYKALCLQKRSAVDQEVLAEQLDRWKQEEPTDSIYFRPCSCRENDEVEPLLICYQTQWQRELLKKYGAVTVLDATYRTTRCFFPLYFLIVKTDASYTVVGMFVLQIETSELIMDALKIFRQWNAEWMPSYWLTDESELGISAIEGVFGPSRIYICSLYREQAWFRWIKEDDNLDVASDGKVILRLWRRIAATRTEESYCTAVDEIQRHPACLRNPKSVQYFQTQWLTQPHRWVEAYNDEASIPNMNVADGLKFMNKLLRDNYLKNSSDHTLIGMLKRIIKDYLPDMHKNVRGVTTEEVVLTGEQPISEDEATSASELEQQLKKGDQDDTEHYLQILQEKAKSLIDISHNCHDKDCILSAINMLDEARKCLEGSVPTVNGGLTALKQEHLRSQTRVYTFYFQK